MKKDIQDLLESFKNIVLDEDLSNQPILTAYVNNDPTDPSNQKAQPAWKIDLKNAFNVLVSQQDPELMKRKEHKDAWDDYERRLDERMRDHKNTGKSVVIFMSPDNMFSLDLPVNLPTSVYYGLPQIKHVLFAIDQYKKYLVIMLSKNNARFLELFLTRASSDTHFSTESHWERLRGRKPSPEKESSRAREYENRQQKEIAEYVSQYCFEDGNIDRIILAGNPIYIKSFKGHLLPAIYDLVIGVETMETTLSDAEVAQQLQPLTSQFEKEHDLIVIEDMISRFNRDGTALVEPSSIERALNKNNIKKLVLPYPIAADKFDPLIVECFSSGAEIEFVYGEAADKLNHFGGVGAFLYFSEPQ